MSDSPLVRYELDKQLAGDPAVSAAEQRAAALRLAFWQARYRRQRHAGYPADLFLGCWADLLILKAKSGWRIPVKKIGRHLNAFFRRAELSEAMQDAGAEADRYLQAELDDSILLYFRSCRTDSRYTTNLFGMLKLKDEQVAAKSAAEAVDGLIRPLLALVDFKHNIAMIHAVCRAYPEVFPEFSADFKSRLLLLDQETNGKYREYLQILE